MSILVVGSVALDDVETPHGSVKNSLGGSALFFGVAAGIFTPVNLVGVVGEDFDLAAIEFLKSRGVDFRGLTVEPGETFRWGGRYHANINKRDTLYTYLNVFENFQPAIPEHYRRDPFVFLANIDPELQLQVLEQMERPRLTLLDTMNFWIHGKQQPLLDLIPRIDVLILNDEELQELTDIAHLYRAAESLLQLGPQAVVVKKGEHGAVLIDREGYFTAPAYPVEKVVDPTGAGDSFAGGFLGYLATCDRIDDAAFRKAIVYGTVMASFTVEDFSFNRLKTVTREELDRRLERVREMTRF